MPSLLVYNIPPPDVDLNLLDFLKSIVALGISTFLCSALIVINLVGNGAPSGFHEKIQYFICFMIDESRMVVI